MADSQRTPEVRFWSKVQKSDGCWLWTGSKNALGYGLISAKTYGTRKAHRFSWMATNGPIPDGMFVLHCCDNPPCVRPDHLFLGDAKANVLDMHAKGRDRNGTEGQTHCKRGHEFSEANTYIDKAGKKTCRLCLRLAKKNFAKKNPSRIAAQGKARRDQRAADGLCVRCGGPKEDDRSNCAQCRERIAETNKRYWARRAAKRERD